MSGIQSFPLEQGKLYDLIVDRYDDAQKYVTTGTTTYYVRYAGLKYLDMIHGWLIFQTIDLENPTRLGPKKFLREAEIAEINEHE